jgi:periplasmic divalent cation tolerance protein
MKETDLLRATTATPDLEAARILARSAADARLAGNAQIFGPLVSVFRQLGESDLLHKRGPRLLGRV